MSYKLIDANNIAFNSDGFITAENIEKMPCIYADLPNGIDGEHYVLEQEPCEDCISRQAAIDSIRKDILNYEGFLTRLPSVNPQPKTDWIPASKILPKEDGEYLVTAVVHDEDYMLHDIPFVDVMRFDKEYADMFDNGWTNTYTSEFYYGVEVTAWMPYFEPYRTESEDVK